MDIGIQHALGVKVMRFVIVKRALAGFRNRCEIGAGHILREIGLGERVGG